MYVMRMHMSYLLIFPCSFFIDPSYSIYNVFNYASWSWTLKFQHWSWQRRTSTVQYELCWGLWCVKLSGPVSWTQIKPGAGLKNKINIESQLKVPFSPALALICEISSKSVKSLQVLMSSCPELLQVLTERSSPKYLWVMTRHDVKSFH